MSELLPVSEIDSTSLDIALTDTLSVGYGLQETSPIDSFLLYRADHEMAQLRYMSPDEELRGNGYSRAIYLKPRNLVESIALSGRPTPALGQIGEQFEGMVRDFGSLKGIPLLADWTCNKAVINKIPGKPEAPGRIKEHTDPKRFSGVVIVLSFEEATLTIEGNAPEKLSIGSMEVFTGRDLSLEVGVKQPKHSIETDRTRYSVAFLNDKMPPRSFRYMFSRLLDIKKPV